MKNICQIGGRPTDNIFMFVVIGLDNCDFIHNIKPKIGDNGKMEKALFGGGSEKFIRASELYFYVNNIWGAFL